jgi:hypothetical protein
MSWVAVEGKYPKGSLRVRFACQLEVLICRALHVWNGFDFRHELEHFASGYATVRKPGRDATTG